MADSKLVSMKVTKAEREAEREKYTTPINEDAPSYPWGLQLNLGNAELEKLGVDLPDVDGEVVILARAKVTSRSSNQTISGKNESATLQITDLCLEDAPKGRKSTEDVLYESEG